MSLHLDCEACLLCRPQRSWLDHLLAATCTPYGTCLTSPELSNTSRHALQRCSGVMKPGLSARSSLLLPLLLAVAHSLVVSALQQGRRGTQLAVPGAGATRATWGGGDAAGAPPLSLLSLSDARSTMRGTLGCACVVSLCTLANGR